jgi:hypothetical protein
MIYSKVRNYPSKVHPNDRHFIPSWLYDCRPLPCRPSFFLTGEDGHPGTCHDDLGWQTGSPSWAWQSMAQKKDFSPTFRIKVPPGKIEIWNFTNTNRTHRSTLANMNNGQGLTRKHKIRNHTQTILNKSVHSPLLQILQASCIKALVSKHMHIDKYPAGPETVPIKRTFFFF